MEAIEILAGIFALGILLKMVSITLYPNAFAKTTEKFISDEFGMCLRYGLCTRCLCFLKKSFNPIIYNR